MTILKQENLVEAMESTRKNVCCYAGDPCDCKYGVETRIALEKINYCGEKTGCPEMRQAVAMVKEMTPVEYRDILSRILDGGRPR